MAFLTIHSTAVAFSIETVTELSEREATFLGKQLVSKYSDKYCVHPDSPALSYLNLNVNSSSHKVVVVDIHKDTMCLNMNPLINYIKMQTQDITDNRDLSLILQLSDSLWLSSWCQSQSVPKSGFKRFVPNGPSQRLRACKTGDLQLIPTAPFSFLHYSKSTEIFSSPPGCLSVVPPWAQQVSISHPWAPLRSAQFIKHLCNGMSRLSCTDFMFEMTVRNQWVGSTQACRIRMP